MRDPGRLVEAQVLARAGVRALAAAATLGGPPLRAPGATAAVFALAAAATAILERAAILRALDRNDARPGSAIPESTFRAAREASAAASALLLLGLTHVALRAGDRAGPGAQVDGLAALLGQLRSIDGETLVFLALFLAGAAVAGGAISGALTIERLHVRKAEPAGPSLWLFGASLVLGFLVFVDTLAFRDEIAARLVPASGLAVAVAICSAFGLHLGMLFVYFLDRVADELVRTLGVPPSAVEGPAPSPTEPPG